MKTRSNLIIFSSFTVMNNQLLTHLASTVLFCWFLIQISRVRSWISWFISLFTENNTKNIYEVLKFTVHSLILCFDALYLSKFEDIFFDNHVLLSFPIKLHLISTKDKFYDLNKPEAKLNYKVKKILEEKPKNFKGKSLPSNSVIIEFGYHRIWLSSV